MLFVTVVVGSACSDDESATLGQPTPSFSNVDIQRALFTLENLSSYHLTITSTPPPEDPLRTTHFEMDFVAPDIFRVVSTGVDGVTKQLCKTYSAAGSTSERCRDVLATVTGKTVVEAVWNSKVMFLRECSGPPSCSGAWQELPYVATYAPSVGPYYAGLPNWHMEAVQGAYDIHLEQGDGTTGPLLHFQGRFNPIRVFLEAARRFYGEDAVSGGGSCGVGGSVDLRPDATPEVTEECRSVESASLMEGAEAYDSRPVPIDIWLSPTDSTIQRILAVVPQPLPGDTEISVNAEYSMLNTVHIDLPPGD